MVIGEGEVSGNADAAWQAARARQLLVSKGRSERLDDLVSPGLTNKTSVRTNGDDRSRRLHSRYTYSGHGHLETLYNRRQLPRFMS